LPKAALEAGPGPAVDVQEHAAAGLVDLPQRDLDVGLERQRIDDRIEHRHPRQHRAGRRLGGAAHQRQVLGVLDLGVVDVGAPRLARPEEARAQPCSRRRRTMRSRSRR
jgi:hypothetical protein